MPKSIPLLGRIRRRTCILSGTIGLLLGILLFASLWYFPVRGLIRPYRVASGSMIPALYGPHYRTQCPDCRFAVRTTLEQSEVREVVCPNCSHAHVAISRKHLLPGSRVTLESRFHRRKPLRRLDVVSYAADANQLAVKRVIGLPGERIAIQQGELFVNDQLCRKSFDEMMSLAALVHDDSYRPTGADSSARIRWRTITNQPARFDDGYRLGPRAPDAQTDTQTTGSQPPDWIRYSHFDHNGVLAPVTDNYPENASLSRPLYFVRDLAVTGELAPSNVGTWHFQIQDGDHNWLIRWETAQQLLCVSDGDLEVDRFTIARDGADRPPREGVARPPANRVLPRRCPFALALTDCQLMLILDNQVVLRRSYALPAARGTPPSVPIGIGWEGRDAARVSQLRVWRDLYWLHPHHLQSRWQLDQPTRDQTYFVLGDNQPLSRDGRVAKKLQCLPAAKILGRVNLQ